MAGRRLSMLKSLCKSTNCSPNPMSFQLSSSYGKFVSYADSVLVRPSYAFVNRGYHTKETESHKTFVNTQIKALGSGSLVNTRCYGTKPSTAFSPTLSSSLSRCAFPPVSISPILGCRSYSSFFGSNADKDGQPGVPAASSGREVDVGNSGVGGSDLVDKVKEFVQGAADAVTHTGQKAKEASSEISPYVQQLLDAYPHLRNVVTPVGCTLAGTIFAWLVMPRLFRRFHKYASLGRTALLSGSLEEQVPYEKSFWGALEDPVRYLFTFMAFSQIGTMVAPTAIAAQYLAPAWRGAAIISFVWFLYRWKTNVYTRALATKSLPSSLDREKLLALDKISSVGLFMIGIMALAEACGVAVQSIMTVGGIGGVATAFAARDVLGNVLSGLSMQFTKPFSLGDTIKAGSIEGQVVDMGLTTTSLLNAEKFPVIVPNSLFSSQVIVNKSRAQWRGIVTRIPLQINDDLDKVPQISDDIKSMLRSHPKVFLGKEVPYCFLSRLESSFGELTLGCNLKQMSKDELFSTEEDILLRSVKIIKGHGAKLGSTYGDMITT
ncbi:putative mechanosensitive ion channel MscS, LSM domain-containing protein [Rosa chinensis]|uniref:Putative mechanosensitive ion channel MscS, LSM domain-containing protein n=1 Tax=Rosa chinensis TaxID=74649 RepID=A0A2P6SHR7_ROSCH|nr:mechanosensitive ion channel protein 1, mitochondrial [Rosa chinensis]PRQ58235.1 putative mechanosensitive ion channel MscS, LSM domain-containing protein [Rosa chinensis]